MINAEARARKCGARLAGGAARANLPAMRARLASLPILAALALPTGAPAWATPGEVFSAANLPPSGLASASLAIGFAQHYRGAVPHAAFAFTLAEDGRAAWAIASGHATPEAAEQAALRSCEAQLAALRATVPPCRILARDGAVEGGPAVAAERGALGPFARSAFHAHRGPGAARGVVVWGHGYGGPRQDHRGAPLPGFLTALNEAGYDILRFDRHPGDDPIITTLPRLQRALPLLREAGYREVVLAGQSRGAWQALLAAAARPELVDAVIAAAPAAHGEMSAENASPEGAIEDFQRLLAGVEATRQRVLLLLFEEDAFDPDPARRARLVEELAARRAAPTLVLWPQGGARGHSGVADWRFTRDQTACVVTWLTAPEASALRGVRRRPCGGG
jgi:pimeloyl-ACP methyl ester carboxylesterase